MIPLRPASFHRVVSRLAPMLLLVLLALIGMNKMVDAKSGYIVPSDQVAYDLSVADHLRTQHAYGLNDQLPVAMAQNSLWNLLVSVTGKFVNDLTAAANLLNLLLGLCLILLTVRLAELVFPFFPFTLTCGIVVASCLFVQSHMVLAGPGLLAACLLVAATHHFIRGITGDIEVLSLRSSMFVGLAAMICPEYAAVWILFFVTALVFSLGARARFAPTHVLLQGGAGLCVVLLALWPLVNHNAKNLGVVWPIAMQQGYLNFSEPRAGSRGIEQVIDDGHQSTTEAGGMERVFAEHPLLQGLSGILLLVLLGLGFVSAFVHSKNDRRAQGMLVIPVVALLFPMLYGVLSGKFGWGSESILLPALTPLMLVFGMYGLFRLSLSIARESQPGVPTPLVLIWGLAALIWTGVNGMQANGQLQSAVVAAEKEQGARNAWKRWENQHSRGSLRIMTDRPGWVTRTTDNRVCQSLGPQATRNILAALDLAEGKLDLSELKKVLHDSKPHVLLLFEEKRRGLARRIHDMVDRGQAKMLQLDSAEAVVFRWN